MNHLSTLALHQLRYGELPGDRAAEANAHIDGCPRCRGRLQTQMAARREFELMPVPTAITRLARPKRAWWLRLPALALGLAVALFVLRLPGPSTQGLVDPHGSPESVRSKGEAAEILREGGGNLASGAVLHPGDRLQVRVAAGPWAQAWVADADQILGRFPLERGVAGLSPFSLTIDEAPGPENLVLLLSPRLLSDAEAAEALAGPLPPDVKRVAWSFVKAR